MPSQKCLPPNQLVLKLFQHYMDLLHCGEQTLCMRDGVRRINEGETDFPLQGCRLFTRRALISDQMICCCCRFINHTHFMQICIWHGHTGTIGRFGKAQDWCLDTMHQAIGDAGISSGSAGSDSDNSTIHANPCQGSRESCSSRWYVGPWYIGTRPGWSLAQPL